MTILEAFIRYDQELQAQGLSEKTRKNYRTALNSLMAAVGDIPIEFITFDVVTRWQLTMRSRGMQPSTIKGNLCRLREVLKYLRRQGYKVIDSRDIDLPKVPKKDPVWLEFNEVDQLLNVIESKRDRALISALFASGARISELLQLNRDSIKGHEAHIIGKGDKPGVIYFDERSLYLINDYVDSRKDQLTPLFVSGQYRRITVSRVEQLLHTYTDMAGIDKNVTPHVLRHSFASDLKLNGADIYDISKLLRHKQISTTMMYAHIKEEKNQANYEKYHSSSLAAPPRHIR
jgi:site-specific recombinase XerD